MLRLPVKTRTIYQNIAQKRLKSSSSNIRNTFIEYFTEIQGHKHVKSSSVVPLCDPTVPFVNAGMNQFKGVFLDRVSPPSLRAVNSQKCIRVGGKHNDLDAVGLDGHHHTFFEMLGNWSFGDYYKNEACQMAWELLTGAYQLKPEDLVVTYFKGDSALKLEEDKECRDIWKSIGVPSDRIRAMDAADNFWEMGLTGPCGPCTEIHYINPDGNLTEIWNIVFIQYNREIDSSVTPLSKFHVDTGMGLERMSAILQSVSSNYDTDLFQPIIKAIEGKTSIERYTGDFGPSSVLDTAYRRLADHARMISVCLADGAFPATNLNVKHIMRRAFKISEDIFKRKQLVMELYDNVAESLGGVYPELVTKSREAKKIIEHEEQVYEKLRAGFGKKWKELVLEYPEVEVLNDVELSGFAQGYREFKKAISNLKTPEVPGEVMFKLYDTHGFHEDIIERVANINNLQLDKECFKELLKNHKNRHKTAFTEQKDSSLSLNFNSALEKLHKNGIVNTNDDYKYKYNVKKNEVIFEPLKTKIVAILKNNGESIDNTIVEDDNYYLITEKSNFYCEQGGQMSDEGLIKIGELKFLVDSVFKIKDYVFHKGHFENKDSDRNIKIGDKVYLEIDSKRRLNLMRNHTAIHLLNAAIRKTLSNSVVCQIGSHVTESGFSLNLSVYGDKLTQKIVSDAQDLIRKIISLNVPIETRVLDSVQLSEIENVVTVPGEVYPETGLRLVQVRCEDFLSRELCCGTHVPKTGFIQDLSVTLVKGAGSQAPRIHAVTGELATQVRELTCKADKLNNVFRILDSNQVKKEIQDLKRRLADACGTGGAPFGDYGKALAMLDQLQKKATDKNEIALESVAETEMRELCTEALQQGRLFLVHFLRCSYMMESVAVSAALSACGDTPALVLGCANGTIYAGARLPQKHVTKDFTAEKWLSCILPVFQAGLAPLPEGYSGDCYAVMTGTKVSLITCEQLVQDAMRAAIKYADAHANKHTHEQTNEQDRQQN